MRLRLLTGLRGRDTLQSHQFMTHKTCKKHPKYRARQKPRVLCRDCWEMYWAVKHLQEVLLGRNRKELEFEFFLNRTGIEPKNKPVPHVTWEQINRYLTLDELTNFNQWIQGQTTLREGPYLWDVRRWFEQGMKTEQGADWD